MRYLFLAALVGCMACGGGNKQETASDSTVTPADAAAMVLNAAKGTTPANCSEDQAIEAVRKLPEVVKQQHYLDSLTKHQHGVNYMTSSKEIDGKEYYQIDAGYSGEFRRENYWTFYVDKQDCSTIRVSDNVEGTIISVDEWHQKEGVVEKKTVTTRTVKLPFSFDEYYDACVSPGDKNKCNDAYPSYPIDNDATLKAMVDKHIGENAVSYFVLPKVGEAKVYIIAFTQTDIERYYLMTVVNDKFSSRLQIGEVEDNQLKYFTVNEGREVSTYLRKNRGEKGKLLSTYWIQDNGLFAVN